jgi:hypothetical protein
MLQSSRFRLIVAMGLMLISGASALADQGRPVYESKIDKCNMLASTRASKCIEEVQVALDADIALLMQRPIDLLSSNSFAGLSEAKQKDAIQEAADRLRLSDEAWRTYRDAHCVGAERYYTHAPLHPASVDHRIRLCKAMKSLDRIDEMKRSYIEPFE